VTNRHMLMIHKEYNLADIDDFTAHVLYI